MAQDLTRAARMWYSGGVHTFAIRLNNAIRLNRDSPHTLRPFHPTATPATDGTYTRYSPTPRDVKNRRTALTMTPLKRESRALNTGCFKL